MTLLDNISSLLGDDLKRTITPGAKLKIAASCFSIYAFEALKKELGGIRAVGRQSWDPHHVEIAAFSLDMSPRFRMVGVS